MRGLENTALRTYMLEHTTPDGATSTLSWAAIAREFGVTRWWVSELAVKLGIRTLPVHPMSVRVCPDCGDRKTLTAWQGAPEIAWRCLPCRDARHAKPPLLLQCSACGQQFERAGQSRGNHLQRDRRKERRYTICPACHTAGVTAIALMSPEERRSIVAAGVAGRRAAVGVDNG